jgi:hypothetical protein
MNKKTLRGIIIAVACALIIVYGIKPLLTDENSREVAIAETKVKNEYKLSEENNNFDVIVVGGQVDGIVSAVSSAREGLSTLLLYLEDEEEFDSKNTLNIGINPRTVASNDWIPDGIFKEIFRLNDNNFSFMEYQNNLEKLINKEKKLKVVRNANILSIEQIDANILQVEILKDDKEYSLVGKVYIDSTRKGEILKNIDTPSFTGGEDINQQGVFQPITLNFVVKDVNFSLVEEDLYSSDGGKPLLLQEYNSKHDKLFLKDLYLRRLTSNNVVNINENDGNEYADAIINGVVVYNPSLFDAQELLETYKLAKEEIDHLFEYLKNNSEIFKNSTLGELAKNFQINEINHFKGEYVLTVSDILDNKDFSDKIAIGNNKIWGNGIKDRQYIIGNPEVYSIPVGCVIPKKAENVLMTGDKVSYTSLAATSASELPTDIALAEAVGLVAKYCIDTNITIGEMYREKDKHITPIQNLIRERNIYLPEIQELADAIAMKKTINKQVNLDYLHKWSYPDIKEAAELGLISGGEENTFVIKGEAVAEDLVNLLLNGIQRSNKKELTEGKKEKLIELGTNEPLSLEKVTEILAVVYNFKSSKDTYTKLYENGYIAQVTHLEFERKPTLSEEGMINLGVYTINRYLSKSN